MADVKIDYAQVNGVANQLQTQGGDIQVQLGALQRQVASLLTPEGGLWMALSSPVLGANYENFNTSLTQVIASIGQFATTFQTIAQNFQQMDQSIAAPGAGDS
jgi:WXG100 family type VII secretion target